MQNTIFDKTQLNSLFDELQKAKTTLIFGHKSPDGDSIGSTLALHHYLAKKGIKSQVIHPDGFPNFLKWMPATDSILLFDKHKVQVTELIANADVIFNLEALPILKSISVVESNFNTPETDIISVESENIILGSFKVS